jgi:hypothetical protein
MLKRQHMGDESIEHSCTCLLMESKRIAGLLVNWLTTDSDKVRNKPRVTIQKRNDQFKSDIQQDAERRCQACA